MEKLMILVLVLSFAAISCSGDDCRTCTGTVTNTGETADFTVCDVDGTLMQTNNISGATIETENSLPESVAFLESIGLECRK